MAGPLAKACDLHFTEDFSQDRFKLLELGPELEQILTSGTPVELVIKGPSGAAIAGRDYSATLCTKDATYLMRKAESSNTHFLLPPASHKSSDDKGQQEGNVNSDVCNMISGQIDFAYELIRIAPRLSPMLQLLQEHPFDEALCDLTLSEVEAFSEEECNNGAPVPCARLAHKGWAFKDLAAYLQASEVEIANELERLGAFELQGRWMTIATSLENDVFELCVAVSVEHGMDADSIQVQTVMKQLAHRFGDLIILQVLNKYRAQGSPQLTAETKEFALNKLKTARFCAEQILRRANDAVAVNDFERSWELALPNNVPTDPRALAGVAISFEEGSGGRKVYRYFPASRLSMDAKVCFAELFATRKQWKLVELEPYISHLIGPNTKKADLLRRFTRSVRVSLSSDERVLTAR